MVACDAVLPWTRSEIFLVVFCIVFFLAFAAMSVSEWQDKVRRRDAWRDLLKPLPPKE